MSIQMVRWQFVNWKKGDCKYIEHYKLSSIQISIKNSIVSCYRFLTLTRRRSAAEAGLGPQALPRYLFTASIFFVHPQFDMTSTPKLVFKDISSILRSPGDLAKMNPTANSRTLLSPETFLPLPRLAIERKPSMPRKFLSGADFIYSPGNDLEGSPT